MLFRSGIFLLDFFLMWAIFKVFIEFVTILLLFYVLVFWPRGTWDLSFPTRDQTCTPCIGRCAQSCLNLCDPMDCSQPGSSVHGDSPGKNTGVGFHALLQGIFPNQGSNPGLPHYRRILYQRSRETKYKLNGKFKYLKIISKSLSFFPQKLLKCIS